MRKITAIQVQKRSPNRVNIHLDGEFAFGLSRIVAAWLKVGQELSEEKIEQLLAADAKERAYQQAMLFLSNRARSESEIRGNLRKHEIPEAVIDETIGRLREDGLANDQQGPADVTRLHGSIWEVSCWNRCPASPPRWRDDTVPFPELPPRCPHCGGLVRPGVVWFGEPLPPDALARADAATECDVFITAGTSAIVYSAAGYLGEAKARGAFTVGINPEAAPASGLVSVALRGPAEEVLPSVERRLRERQPV